MKFIVTTTINPPTEALRRFAVMPGWTLVVVGDQKTPKAGWDTLDCVYLDCDAQDEIDAELSDLIGWNCIQRRMMGVVYAMQRGASLIATVDDDNLPDADWHEQVIAGQTVQTRVHRCDLPAFDPLSITHHSNLWHRGFPIQWVAQRRNLGHDLADVTVDVQAMLWDGDPDVDAVCRMEHAPQCGFARPCQPFTGAKPAPFNSQNTVLTAAAACNWFCFPGIGRMDDIWGAYVCQAYGNRAVFTVPTVKQERNQHDPTKDLAAEYLGMMKTHELVRALAGDPEAWRRFVPEKSAAAFDRYRELVA